VEAEVGAQAVTVALLSATVDLVGEAVVVEEETVEAAAVGEVVAVEEVVGVEAVVGGVEMAITITTVG
jgi:hypothetical protein